MSELNNSRVALRHFNAALLNTGLRWFCVMVSVFQVSGRIGSRVHAQCFLRTLSLDSRQMQLKFLCEVVLEQRGSVLSSVSDQNTDVLTRSCWLLFKLRLRLNSLLTTDRSVTAATVTPTSSLSRSD